MDDHIESYISQIVSGLNTSNQEKSAIAEEMRGHLKLLIKEYIEKGFTEEEATKAAIESFGKQRVIQGGLQQAIFPYYKWFKALSYGVFSAYILMLIWNLLGVRLLHRVIDQFAYNPYFRYPPGSSEFMDLEVWKINSNMIPFLNTVKYILGGDNFNLNIILHNTIGHVLIFLPLGIFLPLLFKSFKVFPKFLICILSITLLIEILQFFLQIGQFDIDDIILNTIGSVMGYMVFKMFNKIIGHINLNVLRSTTK